MHLSTLTSDASFCGGEWPMQRPTSGQGSEKKALESAWPWRKHLYYKPSPQGSGVITEEELERMQESNALFKSSKLTQGFGKWQRRSFWYHAHTFIAVCKNPRGTRDSLKILHKKLLTYGFNQGGEVPPHYSSECISHYQGGSMIHKYVARVQKMKDYD